MSRTRGSRPCTQLALAYLAPLEALCKAISLPGQLINIPHRKSIDTEHVCNQIQIHLADFDLSTDRAASWPDPSLRYKVGDVAFKNGSCDEVDGIQIGCMSRMGRWCPGRCRIPAYVVDTPVLNLVEFDERCHGRAYL